MDGQRFESGRFEPDLTVVCMTVHSRFDHAVPPVTVTHRKTKTWTITDNSLFQILSFSPSLSSETPSGGENERFLHEKHELGNNLF